MNPSSHCWGIGLARTGNTSFCAALPLLGYGTVTQDPKFEELRDLDGASGNCVVLHFKYLDYLFPCSKFVLTTRAIEAWLRSMEIAHIADPRPIQGQHERIARRMAIYECVDYDEEVLSGAFHRHHTEVRRYFAERPNDLLELDISAGEGWQRLCGFLRLPVPDVPFPMLNQSHSAAMREP